MVALISLHSSKYVGTVVHQRVVDLSLFAVGYYLNQVCDVFFLPLPYLQQSDKTGSTSGTGTIRTYPELDGSQNSELFTTLHLPLHMAAVAAGDLCTSLPNVPEFPRHQLRLLEKLGEGAFGMVILHSQWLKITQKSSFLLYEPFSFSNIRNVME